MSLFRQMKELNTFPTLWVSALLPDFCIKAGYDALLHMFSFTRKQQQLPLFLPKLAVDARIFGEFISSANTHWTQITQGFWSEQSSVSAAQTVLRHMLSCPGGKAQDVGL